MNNMAEKEAMDRMELELDTTVKNGRSKKNNIAYFNENLGKKEIRRRRYFIVFSFITFTHDATKHVCV